MMDQKRCSWCCDNGIMQKYHDEEWGTPLHDDQKHFEFLMMEVMQCGLNWNMMLKKREIFRECFDHFDYQKIALYDEAKIQKILEIDGMIHSVRKIKAVINNAQCFLRIIQQFGSFDQYLWGYSNGKMKVYRSHQAGYPVTSNPLSDKISKDLKQYGFKFLGSITVYSHLQACGMINDHHPDCWKYAKDIGIAKENVEYCE